MYAYCPQNDILIKANNLKEAREYAEHRLSPAYGFEQGRAESLKLRVVSAFKADQLEGSAIVWQA